MPFAQLQHSAKLLIRTYPEGRVMTEYPMTIFPGRVIEQSL